jgi:[ribosomal protein S18]-alanine N-acetyltransferase
MPAAGTTRPGYSGLIRAGTAEDLTAIAAIQASSPQAAHWAPAAYLSQDLLVAVCDGSVAGFVVARTLTDGEHEILNLAVAPEFRRRRVASALLASLLKRLRGVIFLEVRESNRAAQSLYNSLGFQIVTKRPQYYESPPEAAVVMKFHSC